MNKRNVLSLTGGGGSPEQSQEVVSEHQFGGNYEQSSARRGKPRFDAQARALAFYAKGGEPTERCGFTMAEILLSLTIIGVVAAITLPSLTGNINERTWNTQRKALYARFSQAISLMPALNGYGTYETISNDGSTSINDTAAETFVTAGLSKVLKINNICSENFEDCGIPSAITTLNALSWSIPDNYGSFFPNAAVSGVNTKAAAFETANGESIIVYYNPKCLGSLNEDTSYNVLPKICANFVYDLNGTKGPNTVGKDIGFITALYPSDVKVVAPMPAVRPLSEKYAVQPVDGSISASRACTNFDSEYRLPNADELVAMAVNNNLLTRWENGSGSINGNAYASSSRVPNNGQAVWIITTSTYFAQLASHKDSVWCVKR